MATGNGSRRRKSRDNVYSIDFQYPEPRYYVNRKRKDVDLFNAMLDEDQNMWVAEREAEVKARRKAGAKKAQATRKANFVSKRVPRRPVFDEDDTYMADAVLNSPRTNNRGYGSRISNNPYRGKGAKRSTRGKDPEYSNAWVGKKGGVVEYYSYPHKGRY